MITREMLNSMAHEFAVKHCPIAGTVDHAAVIYWRRTKWNRANFSLLCIWLVPSLKDDSQGRPILMELRRSYLLGFNSQQLLDFFSKHGVNPDNHRAVR